MLCRVCLLDCDDLLEIFDERGQRLKIDSIVTEHFGLQLHDDDQISNKICCTCWLEIENFHAFYVDVQRAQHKLGVELAKNVDPDPDLDEDEENEEYSESEDEEKGINCDGSRYSKFIGKDWSNVSGDIDVFAAPSRTGNRSLIRERNSKTSPEKKIVTISNHINRPSHKIIVANIDISKNHTNLDFNFDTADYSQHNNEKTEEELLHNSFKRLGIPGLTKILEKKELSITAMPQITQNLTTSKESEQKISKHIKLNCELCGKQFNIFSELKYHFQNVHKISGYVVCCNEKLFKRVHLVEHVMKHLDRSRFTKTIKKPRLDKMLVNRCLLCRKVFKSKSSFDYHMRDHKVNGKRSSRSQCQQCGLYVKSRYALHKHIRLHIDRTNDHVCTLCGKKTLSAIALHRHLNNVHYKERKYQCSLCDKAFKWSINLKEHMAIHTGKSLYSCLYCSKTFNASSNLHSHRKKMHREEWEEERRKRLEINEKLSIELE